MNYEIIPTVQVGSESDDLTVAVIYSPFDASNRDVGKVIYRQNCPLDTYLEGLPEKDDWLVHVNGDAIAQTMWKTYIPQPSDMIVVVANVFGGGGDDKGILRVVAMAVVAVAAAYTGGLAAGALNVAGTTTGTLVAGAVGAVVSIAGGALVNALLPMPEMDMGSGSGDGGASQTYGFGKPRTGRGEGGSVPVIYGEHVTGGSMIALDRSIDPDTNDEIISMLLSLSEGEIYDVREVKINDQPIGSFDNVSWEYHNGSMSDRYVSSSFSDNVRQPIDVSRKITTDPIVVELPVGSTSAELMMSLPQGLIKRYEDNNDKDPMTVNLDVKYGIKGSPAMGAGVSRQTLAWNSEYTHPNNRRVSCEIEVVANGQFSGRIDLERNHATHDDNDWVHCGSRYYSGHASYQQTYVASFSASEGEGRYRYRYVLHAANNLKVGMAQAYQYTDNVLNITDCTHDSKRVMVSVPLTARAHTETYFVSISRTNEEADSDYIRDEMWLNEIEAVSSISVRHRGTAMLRATMKATDQLSGMPDVSCIVRGLKVNTYDRYGNKTGFAWSNNPAWIALDVLTRWSKVPHSLIDFNSFVDFAVFCNNNGFQFNGVFDTTGNSWDAVQKILRAGLSQINPLGAKISLIIHQPRDAVMLFNSSNIIKGSFSTNWTSTQDRSNVFECEYFDAAAGNASSLVKIADLEELAKGAPVRETKISLMGVTNRPQAEKLLGIYRATNKFVTMSVSFDAYLDALGCTVGDAVLVQSDHVKWGKSFRSHVPNEGGVLFCDLSSNEVEEYGRNAMVHYPTMVVGSSRVTWSSGRDIKIPHVGYFKRIHAVKVGSAIYHVETAYSDGASVIIRLVEGGLATNQAVELVQFDYVHVSPVYDVDLAAKKLYLTNALPQPLPLDSLVSIGVNSKVAKKFIVTAIKGDGDFQRSISAIEYNESLFRLDGNYDHEEPMNPIKPLTPVRDVRVVEEIYKSGMTVLTRASISWNRPAQGAYKNARLVINHSGRREVVKSVVGMDRHVIEQLKDGDVLDIMVYAIDQGGIECPTAARLQYKIMGTTAPPATVQSFKMQRSFSGIEASWRPNRESDVVGYQLREGDFWDTGKVLVARTDTSQTIIPRTIAGIYKTMVKAIDVNGAMSDEAAYSEIEIFGPDPVSGFSAIQNDRMIVLRWDRHPDPDVTSYVVRRGISFSNSEHLSDVSGSSFTLDSDSVDIEEYFWIQAVDRFGVHSVEPAFARITRNPLEDYNVINSYDFAAAGWKGDRVNFTTDSEGSLIGVKGNTHYEYFERLVTNSTASSRIILRDYPFAQDGKSATWADFDDVSWGEADNVFWVPFGLVDGQIYERDISRKLNTIDPLIYEGYDCSDAAKLLAGVKGSVATNTGAVVHAPIMVRGGCRAVGLSGGKVSFPLSNRPDSQVFVALSLVAKNTIVVKGDKGDIRLECMPAENKSEYHIKVNNGAILILPFDLKSSDPVNKVVNIQVRTRRENLYVAAVLHGNQKAQTAEIPSEIKLFSALEISSETSKTPNCYLRTVRSLKTVEISGETQTAHYLNRFSRACNFTRFERYSAGFYQADEIDVRYSMSSTSLEVVPGISTASAIVDMPDVIDRGEMTIDVDDNVPIKFNRRFTVTPRVVPQFVGSVGAIVETAISVYALDIDKDGFYVACYDGYGNRVKGVINWQASGY